MGSASRESGQICFPDARSRLSCKERGEFNACGETTTHDSTFTGVQHRHFRDLPTVAGIDKAAMTGRDVQAYDAKIEPLIMQGEPLYWTETKSVGFWCAVLHALDIAYVFDLTAGSAGMALACARAGVGYDGCAANEKHAAWLDNVIDHGILAAVTDPKSACHDKELKAKIESYFATAVEQARRYCGDYAVGEGDDENMEDPA